MIAIGLIWWYMVIMKHHLTHVKTQYQYAEFSMDDRDVVWYGGPWSSWNIIWPMPRPNTNMQNLVWTIGMWFDMVVIMKHHLTYAKTQYQYAEFSKDDSDVLWYGGPWSSLNIIWPKSRPNTNMPNLVWMIGMCFDMVVHGHHETSSDPCQDPIPICRI